MAATTTWVPASAGTTAGQTAAGLAMHDRVTRAVPTAGRGAGRGAVVSVAAFACKRRPSQVAARRPMRASAATETEVGRARRGRCRRGHDARARRSGGQKEARAARAPHTDKTASCFNVGRARRVHPRCRRCRCCPLCSGVCLQTPAFAGRGPSADASIGRYRDRCEARPQGGRGRPPHGCGATGRFRVGRDRRARCGLVNVGRDRRARCRCFCSGVCLQTPALSLPLVSM